jgi:hypothetical protein
VIYDSKREANERFVRMLHGGIAGDDEPRQTGTPGFDGGAMFEDTRLAPCDRPRPLPLIRGDEPGWAGVEVDAAVDWFHPGLNPVDGDRDRRW